MDPLSPLAPRSAMAWALAALVTIGCATPVERDTRRTLDEVGQQLAAPPDPTAPASPVSDEAFDGTLDRYLTYAFEHSPELRASYEDWSAATQRPRQARKMPDLTLSYAGFIRSVETRVGPQRHKLGLMQWFPWPTQLTAAGEAEALRARAAQRDFEARALEIAAEVARAYWNLWLVDRRREVLRGQRVVLIQLSAQIRIRVEAGMADLADLAQVDLQVARIADTIAGLDEEERAAAAELVRAVGAPDGTPVPISDAEPVIGRPRESRDALAATLREHPGVAGFQARSAAQVEQQRQTRARRFPSLGLGVDWIITGDAMDPSMPDSGKDAVVAMAAIRLPLSQGAHGAAQREASARRRAFQAREQAALNRSTAALDRALAGVLDQRRRIRLYRGTLVPQAETVFASVQTSYQTGRSTTADLLLAERDLLELQTDLYQAQRRFAIAWAELEQTVGRPVPMIAEGGSRDR